MLRFRNCNLHTRCGNGEGVYGRRRIPVTIETCSVQDLVNRLTGCDMILSTTQVAFGTEIPVFSGVPLLIGVGEEEVLEAMAVKMKEISEG